MNVISGIFGLFLAAASVMGAVQKLPSPPPTYFLATFAAADKSTVVQLPPSPCKPGEDLVTQQYVVSALRSAGIDYDVDLKSGISRANNAKIVCRSDASQPHTQYRVLEVACINPDDFVYLARLRGRSSDKWFVVCKPPRAADTRALQ